MANNSLTRSSFIRGGVGAVGLSLIAGCSLLGLDSSQQSTPSVPLSAPSAPSSTRINPKIGSPTHITLNSAKINGDIKDVGLASDGTLTPPPKQIVWYTGTNAPGMVGNSVIAGHVTFGGPDVFYHLDNTKVGDEIQVKTSTGHILTFEVTKTESVDKVALETRQDVWGSTHGKNLILVSCDPKSPMMNAHHHKSNIVVWSKLVSDK